MVKIIIYTGLSLPFDEAKEILDSHDDVEVIYKRPIKRGDLGHDIKENPDIIGIIDGVFHHYFLDRRNNPLFAWRKIESLVLVRPPPPV